MSERINIPERIHSEIAASILNDLTAEYARRLSALVNTERGRNAPREAKEAVHQMTEMTRALRTNDWTYELLAEWFSAWWTVKTPIESWFVGKFDAADVNGRIRGLSRNVAALARGEEKLLKFEFFSLPSPEPIVL